MDILKVINQKVSKIDSFDKPRGIKAVLIHIEIAERYYERAIKEKDEHYYTDVIYRTNHAFEGILKEAYETFEEKDASKLTPYQIEKYLLDNSLLNDRVLHLFTNYRTNWRNPSTHDYQLFFNGQEAFLAIVTVSSFANILLDQIIENLSFKSEKQRITKYIVSARNKIVNYDSLSFLEKTSEILKAYSTYFMENFEKYYELPYPELLGSLTGFISSFEPQWNITTDKAIEVEGGKVSPDILLCDGNERLIIELKRNINRDYSMYFESVSPALEQLKMHMLKSGINIGIAYYTPAHKDDHIITSLTEDSIREIYSLQQDLIPSPEEIEEMNKSYEFYGFSEE